jgi:hypothetical protein
VGWPDPGRRADHHGPGDPFARAGWRFEEAHCRMVRGEPDRLAEYLLGSCLVAIVAVAFRVRPVPRWPSWRCPHGPDLNLGPHPYQAYSRDAFKQLERDTVSSSVGRQ